jgi:hypothetical protein
MTITPLDLGAWGAIYTGVTLVRSSMPGPLRAESRFGYGRRLAATGYLLIAAGMVVLLGVLVRHFVRMG